MLPSLGKSQKDFLPHTYIQKIENMDGLGGKLTIHGYGSIAYHIQTDDVSKVTFNVKNQPYVPDLKFCLLTPQQIAIDEKNNGLPDH